MTNELNKTDKTKETDIQVSNNEFLAAIFGDNLSDIKPMVTGFSGNPHQANKGVWGGKVWDGSNHKFSAKKNNYFSIAAFNPDGDGQYKRQKKNFARLHALMLDDIGTKIPMGRLTLKPSWLIETSEGNYQAGYVLKDFVTDAGLADQLMKAIVGADLSDPGAGGPTARWARLPVAINGKNDETFHCRVRGWNPDLRYSPEDIVTGLELDMGSTSGQRQRLKTVSVGNEIFTPRPDKNRVIEVLKERRLYKKSLGDNRHDITCPWVHEHTDNVDDGAAYFEPSDFYPIGGFKCHHGHCEHRKVSDLLASLDVELDDARMKPSIKNIPGEIPRISDAAEQELANSNQYYQRGGLIVTVVNDPSTKEILIRGVSQAALCSALCHVAIWEQYRKPNWVRIDPPPRIVSALFDATNYKHLPALTGIARQPYLRDDGTLVTKTGYDEETGMFGVFDEAQFQVPDEPSKYDATDALDMILPLIEEFPFREEVDRSAALTAILAATIRPSLSIAPMYHVKAHQIGSGKSYLCEMISTFASAQHNAPSAFPKNDEECGKVLLAEFMRGPAVIEFDNLTSDIKSHKMLCTALTSAFVTGRILGVSKTATVSTRALILSSGNNVGPIQDMTRRCITINLDPLYECPASREFKNPNPLSDLKKDREKFVSAALTIIRAWIVAGRPKTPSKQLLSYNEWTEFCRQPLLWLGLPDQIGSLYDAMEEDPERELLGLLLNAWYEKYGSSPQMVRKVAEEAGFHGEFYEILEDIAGKRGEIDRRILGWWIKRNIGRIVDGKRFIKSAKTMSATAWSVQSVS